MKRKLSICGAALCILIAQGCSKEDARNAGKNNLDSKKKTNAVAYQDNNVTNFFKRTSGAQAFDGANSVRMQDGTDLWINNDTFYNQLNGSGMLPCIFNTRNTVLRQPASHSWNPANTPTLTLFGNAGLFVTLNSNTWFWPSGGVELGGNAYIWCTELTNSSGGLGFSMVNQLWGQLNLSTNTVSYISVPALSGISFGIGFMKGIDGYVYAFGYRHQGAPSVAANIYVARFPGNNVADWKFWNGSSWVSSSSTAAAIGVAPSSGVYVQWVNTKLVMVSTQFNLQCNQGTAIYAATSNSVTGPFTAQQVIYNIPDRNQGNSPFFYTPSIHPQFNANNEFLITYCINYYQPCIPACQNGQMDPNGYRPRGVRVPFSLLGL